MLTNMSVITKTQSCTMSKAFSSIVLARRNMINRTRLLACRHITTAPRLKAFSGPVPTSRNAVTLNSTHAPLHRKHLTTTAPASTPQLIIPPNIIWTDITNARLDTVDIEAAKLAFQKSNTFIVPIRENFRIDFFMFLKPSDDGDGDSDEKRAAKWKSFYHEQALRVHGVLNKTISTSSASTVSPTDHVTARQWKNASATSSHNTVKTPADTCNSRTRGLSSSRLPLSSCPAATHIRRWPGTITSHSSCPAVAMCVRLGQNLRLQDLSIAMGDCRTMRM